MTRRYTAFKHTIELLQSLYDNYKFTAKCASK